MIPREWIYADSGSFSFEMYQYLGDGLKLVIVGLGIFAIPEIVALLRQDKAISDRAQLGGGWLSGVKDWWANLWLSTRCSLIGVIVGVIPGLGGSGRGLDRLWAHGANRQRQIPIRQRAMCAA